MLLGQKMSAQSRCGPVRDDVFNVLMRNLERLILFAAEQYLKLAKLAILCRARVTIAAGYHSNGICSFRKNDA